MNTIARILNWFDDCLGRILAPVIALIVLVVIYDIGLRFISGRPSDWAFDVTKQLFAAHFMLLGAYALHKRAHAEVDVFKNQLSCKGRAIVELLGYVIFFGPFIWVYLEYTWSYAARSWTRGETTYGIVSVPIYPVKMLMFVAGVLLLLQAVSVVLGLIQQLRED